MHSILPILLSKLSRKLPLEYIIEDLQKKYGSALKHMHILEMGKKESGICKALTPSLGFASYTFLKDTDPLPNKKYDLFIIQDFFNIESFPTDIPNGYVLFKNRSLISSVLAFLIRNTTATQVWEEKSNEHSYQILSWSSINRFNIEKNPVNSNTQKGITYNLSGGRLGDNLVAYFHALWLAKKHGLTFFYKPFPGGEKLALSTTDEPLESCPYSNILNLMDERQIAEAPSKTLIVVPYFSECSWEYKMSFAGRVPDFKVDWEDPNFKALIKQRLTPLQPVPTLVLPQNHISLAVHIRRGGAFENYSKATKVFPLKFPPDSYYIDKIRTIANIYNNLPLYVHLFTDDLYPQKIVHKYERTLKNKNLSFACNSESLKGAAEGMWHDFYSMGKFDSLIRGSSNFSFIASKLGSHTIQATPSAFHLSRV